MRKQLQAEHGKDALIKEISDLEDEKKTQLNKVIELKARIDSIKTRAKERRAVDQKKREEEMKFLEFQRKHLTEFYKQIDDK